MEDNKQHDITDSRGDATPDKHKANETGEKGVVIRINGDEEFVTEKELTFDQVTELAFPDGPKGPDVKFTVRYRYQRSQMPEQDHPMNEGDVVEIKKGMRFNVKRTDKS